MIRKAAIHQPRHDENASCHTLPTGWWFGHAADTVEAFLVCTACPVRAACLNFALDHPGLRGIWGATTKSDRARIRRARTCPPAMVVAPMCTGLTDPGSA